MAGRRGAGDIPPRLEALSGAGRPRSTEYIWNQDRYAMRLQREADANVSRELSAPVDRVHGELENLTQSLRPLRFQIWIDRESPIPVPLRIEFQPRSFLRLTLEAVNHKLDNRTIPAAFSSGSYSRSLAITVDLSIAISLLIFPQLQEEAQTPDATAS